MYPGAFNTTTGPAHWDLLARCRAVDNQTYTVLCSPARSETSEYKAYGHSVVYDPWGDQLARAGHSEEVVHVTLPMQKIHDIRKQLPISGGRRPLSDFFPSD
jgi:omega-amidase